MFSLHRVSFLRDSILPEKERKKKQTKTKLNEKAYSTSRKRTRFMEPGNLYLARREAPGILEVEEEYLDAITDVVPKLSHRYSRITTIDKQGNL